MADIDLRVFYEPLANRVGNFSRVSKGGVIDDKSIHVLISPGGIFEGGWIKNLREVLRVETCRLTMLFLSRPAWKCN